MSFLSPWFLAGALAVAGPIVFHLIRRAARERTPFSSLMFLRPTPPRSERRSRVEHIVLLLLRCACVLLIVLGFARPFFAKDIPLPQSASGGRRLIILLDSSASMRRAGLFDKARAIAGRYLDKTAPGDQAALLTFDNQLHSVVGFADWAAWGPDQRAALARAKLATVAPGWMGTQLGVALTSASDAFPADSGAPQARVIVLISDMQEGARLDGLQGREWPPNTRVVVERVDAKTTSNAGVGMMEPSPRAVSVDDGAHVRVANSSDSTKEKFRIAWTGGASMDVYVPPGQIRTFKAPAPPKGAASARLELTGDDEPFDNTTYYAAPEVQDVTISYLGADSPDDPTKLLYYLQRVFPSAPQRRITLEAGLALRPDAALAVVPGALTGAQCAELRDWIAAGKTALIVLTNADAAPTLAALLSAADAQIAEAAGDFALLGQVDFKHPIFAPFDDPRLSDFSRIHFWKRRRWDMPPGSQARVMAAFDDGSPALAQVDVGKGRLLVLTSGWQPSDSELAVSTKFPPLMDTLLQWSGSARAARSQFRMGESIPSPAAAGAPVQWEKPDGKQTSLPAGAAYAGADMPGIYRAQWSGNERAFAVNLPLEESRVAPLSQDELGRLGVPLGADAQQVATTAPVSARQSQRAELEARQKLWRWAIGAALAVALAEIIIGGWLARGAGDARTAT